MEQEGTSLMEPTGAAPLRPTDLREIGPYRLLGRLGEGGMGTVFLARAPTGRFVALKVVKAEFANQEGFAARFHAEVDNARRVASFCTAQVLDNGNTGDGRPYMVTEYIAGTPLSDQITTYGALDPGPLHGVALGVAAALAAIHVAGLVHRDLKPANVILSLSGPRVIDFGIARALDRETGFTMSGELLGSPGWWAPEQVRGEVVNPAADIFAWGCLVAYAGNGRHPFGRGDPITLATRVLNTPPDLGALPAPLDELVRRATSMDVALRPTAQDLLIALVGGSAPAPVAAAADPPTLVATEMLSEWEPPQNVVDEPDITATFTTPPPSDATGRGPVPGTAPGQGDVAGRAGQSDAAGRVPSVPPSGERAASPMAGGPAAAESSVAAGTGAGGPGSADPATGPSSPSGVPGAPGSPGVSGSFPSAGEPSQGSSYGPAQGSSYGSSPSGLSAEELARREEDAAKEELARWKVPDQGPPERQGRLRALFGFGTSPRTGKTGTDESPTDGSQAGGSQAGGSQAGGSRTDSSSPVRQQPEQAAAQQAPTEQVRLQQPDQSTPGSQQNRLQQPGPQQGGPEQVRPQQDRPDQVRPLQPGPQQDRPGWPGAPSGPGWRPEQGVAVPQGAALGTETQPGVRTAVPGDDSDTIGGTRTPGTRWLIAAAAAVLAIVVTAGVLIVTSARNTAVTGTPGTPTQVVGSAKPNDVGRRFALGANFDDPVAIVSAAPECGLREYEGITATKGQLCVIRWTMLNPGGERRVLVQPVVTMVDDRGGEHDSIPVTLPPAILPGARVDSAFVFDLATYRKPVSMTANMLENGQQIEVAL